MDAGDGCGWMSTRQKSDPLPGLPLTLGGKVYEWFGALPEKTKVRNLGGITTTNAQTIINTIKNEIRREFLGEDYAQHRLTEKRKKRQKYLTMLYNLQICDINYFDAYVCEFEKYYYKFEVSASTQTSLNFHNDMFFTKLSYPWCDIIFSKWKETDGPERTDTLGGRIEFARMTLAHECKKAYKRRKLQKDHKKLKCKDQLHYPSKFGYDTKSPKLKKKFKAKKLKGKKVKKKAKPFKIGKTTPPFKAKRNFFKKKKNEAAKPTTKQIQ